MRPIRAATFLPFALNTCPSSHAEKQQVIKIPLFLTHLVHVAAKATLAFETRSRHDNEPSALTAA
jgi:hypothetical protein